VYADQINFDVARKSCYVLKDCKMVTLQCLSIFNIQLLLLE